VWDSRGLTLVTVVVVVGSRMVAPPLLRVVRCLSHIVLCLGPRPCLVSTAWYRMVAFLPGRRIGCFPFLSWFPVAFVSDVSSISYIERGSYRYPLSRAIPVRSWASMLASFLFEAATQHVGMLTGQRCVHISRVLIFPGGSYTPPMQN
jgi:hypothetical protein